MKRLNVIHDREWNDRQPFLNCYKSPRSANLRHHITSWEPKNSELEKAGVDYHSFKVSSWPHPKPDGGRKAVVVEGFAALETDANFLVFDHRGGDGPFIEFADTLKYARLHKSIYPKTIFKINSGLKNGK